MIRDSDVTEEAVVKLEQVKREIDEAITHMRLADVEHGDNKRNLLNIADNSLSWAVENITDVRQVSTYEQRGVVG